MKKETIAEFLARGGSITRVPTQQTTVKPKSMQQASSAGPAVIMTMEDAGLYYGEYKPKKAKKKNKNTIDISALPEELRRKYIDGVINGKKENSDYSSEEESNSEESEDGEAEEDGDSEE